MDGATILGLVAGACTSLCSVPQVYRIWKRKCAEDVSSRMYMTLALGNALWIYFGVLQDEISIVITNAVNFCLCCFVIFLKVRFKGNGKGASAAA